MENKNYGLTGLGAKVELGKGGFKVINDGTRVKAMNNAETALVEIQALAGTVDDSVVIKSQLDAKQDQLSVAAGSQNRVSIVNNEIALSDLAIADVTVDVTHSTIADFVAASYTGTEFQEGDVVILTTATDSKRSYIHNGDNQGDVNDFSALQSDLSEAVIRSMFSAGSGITYNSGTGEFTLDAITAADVSVDDSGFTQISGATAQAVFADLDTKLASMATDISNLTSFLGSGGATNLGTNTNGTTIPENATVSGALDSLETAIEAVNTDMQSNMCRVQTFTHESPATFNIQDLAIPSGKRLTGIRIQITEVFDSLTTTLDIGKAGDADAYLADSNIDLHHIAHSRNDMIIPLTEDTMVVATFNVGSSTQGAGIIMAEYC